MYVMDRYRRNSHDFGDDIIGDVDSAWPFRVGLHVSDVKRGSDEPPIAQGDLGYAVPNGRDMERRLLRSDPYTAPRKPNSFSASWFQRSTVLKRRSRQWLRGRVHRHDAMDRLLGVVPAVCRRG